MPSPNISTADNMDVGRQKINAHFNDAAQHGGGSGPSVFVTPEQFGAKGDGVTDDGGALQAALDAVSPLSVRWDVRGGGEVRLSAKTYLTNRNLFIGHNTTLSGAGWGSEIRAGAGCNTILSTRKPSNDITVVGIEIRDLQLHGGARSAGRTGFHMNPQTDSTGVVEFSSRNCKVERVRFTELGIGLKLVWDQGSTFSDLQFRFNTTGARVSDNSQNSLWSQCDFRENVDGALLVSRNYEPTDVNDTIYQHLFARCHFEGNSQHGVVLDGAQQNTFQSCKFEHNSGEASVLIHRGLSIYDPTNNYFYGCLFIGEPNNALNRTVWIKQGEGHSFQDCWQMPGSTQGFVIDAPAKYTRLINFRGFANDGAKLINNSASTTIMDPNELKRVIINAGPEVNWPTLGRSVVLAPAARIGSNDGPTITTGNFSPEGAVFAPPGSLYLRADGSTGPRVYFKNAGTAETGWVAL